MVDLDFAFPDGTFHHAAWPVVPRVGESVALLVPNTPSCRVWEVSRIVYMQNVVERSCPHVYYAEAPGCSVRIDLKEPTDGA